MDERPVLTPAESEVFDVKSFLSTLSSLPGVYRMLDAKGQVLYVGKAKNLKKRVTSYFRGNLPSPRIALMVAQIARVETTTTRSEAEALLLENNLIKKLSPRYNILFRDDKSYPYIVMTRDSFPRLAFYRGSIDRKADFFGPFPSAGAVRESIALLQKMFCLRTCENSVFNNRSRPCLLHQIKRCSAPCVGLVAPEDYARDVRLAALFLQGRNQEVLGQLEQAMDKAAAALNFEHAAHYRDQIQSLRRVKDKQFIESVRGEDADIVAVVAEHGMLCVNLAMVRGGRHLGDRPQFAEHAGDHPPEIVLSAFLAHHYAAHPVPPRIFLNRSSGEVEIGEHLAQLARQPVALTKPRTTMHKTWMAMAEQSARLAIASRLDTHSRQSARLAALLDFLSIEIDPAESGRMEVRIECFDISHTQGESTVASCVVYRSTGMSRQDYRRFNITDIQAGDDYAAIRQAVRCRYEKVASGEGVEPTLILIDGGKGQLSMAVEALNDLGLGGLPIVAVAKGETRKPGLESLIFPDGREPVQLSPEHPALHLIQEIRDEAHRFAVFGHRARRSKTRQGSQLDAVEGIGPKRRKALLVHFGSLQGVRNAGIDQLASVPGIRRELAETIFKALH